MEKLPENVRPHWRLKTADELKSDRRYQRLRRINPLQPVIIGAIFFGLFGAIFLIALCRDPDSGRSDWLFGVAFTTAIALFAFAAAYAFQLVGWLSLSRTPRILICTKCFTLRLPGMTRQCTCGGQLEDAAAWTIARCPACGYDLRGTPERCPECGRAVPQKTEARA